MILSSFCPTIASVKAIKAKRITGVKKSNRIFYDPKRILPKATFLHNGKRFVVKANRRKIYFKTIQGCEILISQCKVIAHNNGLVYL